MHKMIDDIKEEILSSAKSHGLGRTAQVELMNKFNAGRQEHDGTAESIFSEGFNGLVEVKDEILDIWNYIAIERCRGLISDEYANEVYSQLYNLYRTISIKRTICVDFDGVIHAYSKGYWNGKVYDGPVDGAIASIKELQSRGYHVIVFTAVPREPSRNKEVREWLDENGLDDVEVTNTKPPALLYVDDRALRFESWEDTISHIDNMD